MEAELRSGTAACGAATNDSLLSSAQEAPFRARLVPSLAELAAQLAARLAPPWARRQTAQPAGRPGARPAGLAPLVGTPAGRETEPGATAPHAVTTQAMESVSHHPSCRRTAYSGGCSPGSKTLVSEGPFPRGWEPSSRPSRTSGACPVTRPATRRTSPPTTQRRCTAQRRHRRS